MTKVGVVGSAVVGQTLAQGFDLATISTDIRIFVAAVQQELKAARDGQKKDGKGDASSY